MKKKNLKTTTALDHKKDLLRRHWLITNLQFKCTASAAAYCYCYCTALRMPMNCSLFGFTL